MRVLSAQIVINRSPDQVFSVMTDPARAPEWLALLDRVEVVDGGPLAVGSLLRLHFTAGGRASVQHSAVQRLDPGRAYAVATREEGFELAVSYTITPEAPGARVTMEVRVKPTTLSALLIYPWAAMGTRARLADRLQRLKRVVEASPPGAECQ